MSAPLRTTNTEMTFDLDAARAARREKLGAPGVTIGGQRLELPIEFPIDVLAPLTELDFDASVLVRIAVDARKEAEAAGQNGTAAMLDAALDILVSNPKLPMDLVEACKTMARRMFGEDGYTHLAAQRLAIPDIVALTQFVGRAYGVGLGEALQLSDSSEGTGTTSRQTSSTGTRGRTSGGSGKSRAARGS